MKLLSLSLFFIFSFFAATARASRGAGGYEALSFYYAYSMGYDADPQNTVVGDGCTGTGGERCTLSQFLEYCMEPQFQQGFLSGLNSDPSSTKAILNTIDPDVETAATALNNILSLQSGTSGRYYLGKWNFLTLDPHSNSNKFGDVLTAVTNTIQNFRRTSSVDQTKLESATSTLLETQQNRIADQSSSWTSLWSDIKTQYPSINLVFKTVPVTGGGSYETLDTKATLSASPGLTSADKMGFNQWVQKSISNKNFIKSVVSHQGTINQIQSMVSRITDSDPTC